jgi:hypothetical protein
MPDSAARPARGLWFAAFCLACVAGVGAYVAFRSSAQEADGALTLQPSTDAGPPGTPPPAPVSLADIRSGPHVYFLSMRSSEFGRVAVGSLDNPNAARLTTDLTCERVDFGRERGLCLVDNRVRLIPPVLAHIVDRDFQTVHTVELPGFPSRTRMSADERYAATTVFVTGESYLSADFATRTMIIDMVQGVSLGHLEQFSTFLDGRAFKRVDFNFWGVTFTADNRFYATLGTGGKRYLVSGDIERRRIEVLREGVECPALSPDGRHLAFKSRVPGANDWRLHVIELATMREWPIAGETRSVDDQVEWLDNERILYRVIDNRGLPENAANVFVSPVREGPAEAPQLFIRGASSPAVVR